MSILLGRLNEKVKGEKVAVAKLMWCYCLGPLGLSPPGDALKHCAEYDSDLSLWGVRSLGVNTTFIIQCVSVASLTCSWVFNTWRCLLPQFSSVTQSCPTLCDAMDCSMPGFPLHHQLLELLKLMSIKSMMPSNHLILCCPILLLPPIPPSIRVFSNESTLHMRWKSTGVSALASFLPKNIQDWSPLEWTGWISLQSKGLSRVFSNTTVQKQQFFGAKLCSQSNSHIHTWPLEKP